MKRKSEAVEVDATAEKIAKLKETAAEVVAEVSPQFPSTVLVSTWKIPGVKYCNFVRNLQFWLSGSDFVSFLRQQGAKNNFNSVSPNYPNCDWYTVFNNCTSNEV